MPGVPLEHLAVLRFSGADAVRFLHAQVSANLEGLAVGASTFACLCQPKGRVIALLLAWRLEEELLVLCARPLAERIVQHLRRFVFRDDVTIDTPANLTVLGHRDARDRAATPLPGLAYSVAERADAGDPTSDTQPTEEFRAHELAMGVAWLDEASSESFLPQMIGAGAIGALNYRKGCYPGQEVVARTHYLGRLKQRPLLARLNAVEAPAVMDAIQLTDGGDRTAQGRVLDRARRAGGGWQLMLVVRAPDPFEASRLDWTGHQEEIVSCWPEPDTPGNPSADTGAGPQRSS